MLGLTEVKLQTKQARPAVFPCMCYAKLSWGGQQKWFCNSATDTSANHLLI